MTFRDPQLASRARQLRGQGVDPTRRYWFPIVGHNFRLTNLAAAILCARLERFDEMTTTRRQIFDAYRTGLDGTPGVGFQPIASWATQTPWLFSITIDPALYGSDRDEVMANLSDAGIDSRPFFVPIHLLPPYIATPGTSLTLPVTEQLASRGMNLPTFPGLPIADVDRITSVIGQHART